MPAPDVAGWLLVGAVALVAVTGFGGAAVLLTVLVIAFGVRDAVPILTVAQLSGNGSRVWFNRDQLDLRVVGWFAVGAVPLAFLGGLLFARVPLPALTPPGRVPARNRGLPLRSFALIGAAASVLSTLLGSVRPLTAPFFLAYGLVKGAYIGTEALATVVIHVTKLVAHRQAAVLSATACLAGLAIGAIMILGSYAGKQIADRISERAFVLVIELTMITAGVRFLVRGH